MIILRVRNKMGRRRELYRELWSVYKNAHPSKSKDELQDDFNTYWNQTKNEFVTEDAFELEIFKNIKLLQQKTTIDKAEKITNFFKFHQPLKTSTSVSTSYSSANDFLLNAEIENNHSDKSVQNLGAVSGTSSCSVEAENPNSDMNKLEVNVNKTKVKHQTPSQDRSV